MAVSGKTAAPWEVPYFLGTDKPPDMAAGTKAIADRAHTLFDQARLRWYTPTIIATSESRENVAYGTLTTPDKVEGVVLPTNGLIVISYFAQWRSSVANAGRAAIFLGANQLRVNAQGLGASNPVTQAAINGGNTENHILTSSPIGLLSSCGAGEGSGSVTTGTAICGALSSEAISAEINGSSKVIAAKGTDYAFHGGQCLTGANAGTYTVSVQFKATSGQVIALERKLWVGVLG